MQYLGRGNGWRCEVCKTATPVVQMTDDVCRNCEAAKLNYTSDSTVLGACMSKIV